MIGKAKTASISGALFVFVVGCAAKHPVVVPRKCLHPQTITNFTKPCKPIEGSNDKARCDGVIIVYDCVAPKK